MPRGMHFAYGIVCSLSSSMKLLTSNRPVVALLFPIPLYIWSEENLFEE